MAPGNAFQKFKVHMQGFDDILQVDVLISEPARAIIDLKIIAAHLAENPQLRDAVERDLPILAEGRGVQAKLLGFPDSCMDALKALDMRPRKSAHEGVRAHMYYVLKSACSLSRELPRGKA